MPVDTRCRASVTPATWYRRMLPQMPCQKRMENYQDPTLVPELYTPVQEEPIASRNGELPWRYGYYRGTSLIRNTPPRRTLQKPHV